MRLTITQREGFCGAFGIAPLLGVALALSVDAATAAAQQRQRHAVLISAAGGISKGSYQGGVDWTISEFLRRQRDSAWHDRVLGDTAPTYRLGSATGASAGNINALIAAVSWCAATLQADSSAPPQRNIAPEQSLFWKAWVNTGFSEMLGPRNKRVAQPPEPAVLDRTFFDQVHRGAVFEFLDRASPEGDCDVPLGITLTRIAPLEVQLDEEGVSAKVQRFATVLRVTTREGDKQRIDFVAPDSSVQRDASLGALALLPELNSSARRSAKARFSVLFDAVLASSSFPVAFAPRRLCYARGGLALARDELPPNEPACDLFNDGGLFDNNPFGLTLRLYELRDSLRTVPDDSVKVAYTNPGFFRGTLRSARAEKEFVDERLGLSALLQMLGGAWGSAREYELQSLLRQQSRDSSLRGRGDMLKHATISSVHRSTRSSPIFGEYLLSFAAFLGHPLREYDFYTGVYDGLRFVAEHFMCRHNMRDQSCVESAHARLLDENLFDLGRIAREVLSWHRRMEYERDYDAVASSTPASDDSVEAMRLALLAGIHNAMKSLRTRPLSEPCAKRADVLGSLLCSSGLDRVFAGLRHDSVFMRVARKLSERCERHEMLEARLRGECHVDAEFIALMGSPPRHLHTLVTRAFVNLQAAEDSIKGRPGDLQQLSPFTELGHLAYRALDWRYRSGLEINASSAVWDGTTWWRVFGSIAAWLTPNYVIGGRGVSRHTPPAVTVSRTNWQSLTLGWHPLTWHNVGPFALTTNLEYSPYFEFTARRRKHHEAAPGVSLITHQWHPPGTSSLEGGVLWSRHVLRTVTEPPVQKPVLHLTARTLFDKVQLGFRFAPDRGWAVNAGISDVNGMLYWAFR